ncbi:MAG: hypothetical protein DRP52_05025 [Planctomycetota bacterium]|nr:MAG: hypothetical protein DRP52_05025 [Planctomycetota bacterium]
MTDSFEAHIADTIKTGCGIGNKAVIEQVVKEGPDLVRQLDEWGTNFDRTDGQIDITREGGHSHARIAHAHGDSTGRGIVESLVRRVCETPTINIIENFYTIDLLTDKKHECIGVIGRRPSGSLQIIWAGATILATGGAGRLYRETTNPECATADGLAMAWRAGAVLRDMEFMQFHPTTLYIAGASRALVIEPFNPHGRTSPMPIPHCPFRHAVCILFPPIVVTRANIVPSLPAGNPDDSLVRYVSYRPFGASRMPFGHLFTSPAHHPRGPLACRPALLAAVAGLRFPAFGRPRLSPLPLSLRSLTPVAGGIPPRGP